MTTITRSALLAIVQLVRPALATQDYIPALQHIKFDGEYALAFNDISAVMVKCDVAVRRCVPGDLLIRALGSFGGESVALVYDDSKSTLLLNSGRSKLKLPTLPTNDFPFEMPIAPDKANDILLGKDILRGIERCLISVSTDPTHPATMGVTLEANEHGHAVLHSTDNFTISRFVTDSAITLPGDAPVILPTFFCQQLIALSKAFPKQLNVILAVLPSGLLVDFGADAVVFSRNLIDAEPVDFPKIVGKFIGNAVLPTDKVPDAFDSAFDRALLVQSAELDKTTEVKVRADSIALNSTSKAGDSDDEIEFKGGEPQVFLVDPTLVVRALKQCSRIAFLPKTLVLTDETGAYTHLISHCKA